MKKNEWRIPLSAPGWECDWEGSERFHLRHFKTLSLYQKLGAIESMADVVDFLNRKARVRKGPRHGRRR
jgi:hypothetical protein